MTILSRFFVFLFFVVFSLSSLSAQEARNSAPISQENSASQSTLQPTSESQAASNAPADPSVTEAPSSPEQVAAAPEAASVNPAPEASAATAPEGASSIMPTDPSMIPPPEAVPSNPEDAPSVAPSTEKEQSAATPAMPSTESIEKKKQELKVRYYQVRTQVEKEEDVAALKLKADHAATSEEKRQALRAYYETLFSKMKKVDVSISLRCDIMEGAYLRRLEQTILQPTIPLAPPPNTEKSKSSH